MPRKSAAALAVMPPAPKPHPRPPAELTKAQAAVWDEIVLCRSPDYFDGACRALLVQYCRHVVTASVLAGLINRCDPSDLGRYRRLLTMAARESAMLSMLSAKLRLAPQHVRRVEQVVRPHQTRVPWQPVA